MFWGKLITAGLGVAEFHVLVTGCALSSHQTSICQKCHSLVLEKEYKILIAVNKIVFRNSEIIIDVYYILNSEELDNKFEPV